MASGRSAFLEPSKGRHHWQPIGDDEEAVRCNLAEEPCETGATRSVACKRGQSSE